eukprot:s8604_g2.t2
MQSTACGVASNVQSKELAKENCGAAQWPAAGEPACPAPRGLRGGPGMAAGGAAGAAAGGAASDHPLAFTDLLFAVVLPIALMAIFWYFKPKEAARRMGDDDAIELEEGFLLASPFALELPRVPLEAASAASPASPASSASSASPATPVSAVPTLALPAEVQEGTLGTLSSGMTWRGRAPGAATAPLSQHGGPGVEIFHVLEPALRIQSPASNSRRSRWQLYLLKAARWRTFGLQYAAHVKAGCCWQHGPQLTIFGGKVVSEGAARGGVHLEPSFAGSETLKETRAAGLRGIKRGLRSS